MHKKTALDHYPKSISERIDLLYQRITQRQNLPPSLKPFLESILTIIYKYKRLFAGISDSTKNLLFFAQDNPEHLLLRSLLNQLVSIQITFGYILEPGYMKSNAQFVFSEEIGIKTEFYAYKRKDIGKMPSFVMLVEWIWTVKSICIIYYFFQCFKDGYYL